MGGKAFAQAAAPGEPTIRIVRLDKAEYARLKTSLAAQIQSALGPEVCVRTPVETPEKTDYGDLDFLLATNGQVDWEQLATEIGAIAVIIHHAAMCSIAIDKDGRRGEKPATLYVRRTGPFSPDSQPPLTAQGYAQVDFEAVPTTLIEWRSFFNSYGDMVGMLARMIRNLGFTITHEGFYLRLAELERAKKRPISDLGIADNNALLFLSRHPVQLCGFLGLSFDQYEVGFASKNAMFAWLSGCRLLSRKALLEKRTTSDERNRDLTRPLYAEFFDRYLPAHFAKTSTHTNVNISQWRADLAEEAARFFLKQTEYAEQHASLSKAVRNAVASHLMKPLVKVQSGLADKKVTEVMRGVRRFTDVSVSGVPSVAASAHDDANSELHRLVAADGVSLIDEAAVSGFLRAHWEELRGRERRRIVEKSAVG